MCFDDTVGRPCQPLFFSTGAGDQTTKSLTQGVHRCRLCYKSVEIYVGTHLDSLSGYDHKRLSYFSLPTCTYLREKLLHEQISIIRAYSADQKLCSDFLFHQQLPDTTCSGNSIDYDTNNLSRFY